MIPKTSMLGGALFSALKTSITLFYLEWVKDQRAFESQEQFSTC